MTSTTRSGETALPQSAEPERLDGAALVLGYLQARGQAQGSPADPASAVDALLRRVQELEARLAELSTAEQQAQELARTVESLKAYNQQLQETIRTLEIGFRRHVSEQVSPDQLRLSLAGEPGACPAPASSQAETHCASPDADPSDGSNQPPGPASPPERAETAESSSGSEPGGGKRAKRHEHGRRRIGVIPRVIIETLPPEVLLQGIERFERVGVEDSSVIGHRRGGPVEIVWRRPKYVAKAEVPAASRAAGEEPASLPAAGPAFTRELDEPLVVREHELLGIPADTGFKQSPFVDGVLVRYTPESDAAEDSGGPVKIASLPERPIDRCLADPSLLAHLFVHKLDYHTPYYRQEVESERHGFRIGRGNMTRWQYDCGGIAMRIADAIWSDALSRSWFAMDATGTAIRAKDKHRYGHVFVLVAPGDGVLFRYTPTYDGPTVAKLFGGYQGTLVADASANHNVLFGPGKAREAGCWSHARRRFFKAFKAGAGKEAAFALQAIQALFRVEEECALCSPDERLEIRQRESAPLIEKLFAWVEAQRQVVPEHSPLREGLVYLHNQREALCEFLSNGEIPIHNNASERALRRVVKGRRNWLFHGSDEHAVRACAITSLIATCQMHGLDPELYLQEILTVAPSYPLSRILDLSPKNWVATRQRLIAEGRLKYLDLARITGSRLAFRDR
ncbi:IS66 family transposase [Sorangium sp. So ce269]